MPRRSALLPIAIAIAMLCPAAVASAAQAPITSSADSLRTGWYPDQGQLTPQLLASGGFGQIFDTPVQGQVYAQPLVSGDTLLAATEDDQVYGIDAQSGAIRWQRSVGPPFNTADVGGCEGPGPHTGITGTPVIDPDTEVAYFVAKRYASGESGPAVWEMHAVKMSSGGEEPGFPVQISGEAQNLPGVVFDPTQQLQRPALLLMGGVVYAAFGGLCDVPPYQGWVAGVSTAGQIKALWATSPAGASIWQAGGGLVSDGEGQILFSTGNSECNGCGIGGGAPPPGPGDEPPEDLGESVARVSVQPGGSLKATDFFSPSDNVFLDEDDLDLGSGAPLGLPSPYFGTEAIPHLLVEVGKQGVVYLLNRDHLGGVAQGPGGTDDVVQEIAGTGSLWGSPATWPGDGGYVYVPSTGPAEVDASEGETRGSLEVFKYETDGGGDPRLSLVGASPESFGYGSGSPLVSSDGTASGSGIVWISRCPDPLECRRATLDAYRAVPVDGEPQLLWSAPIGISTRFAHPDASGGRIYVGTYDGRLLGFGPRGSTPAVVTTASGSPRRPNTAITRATVKSKKRMARFAFVARGSSTPAHFQCRLIKPKGKHRHKKAPKFSRCRSPRTYKHLKPGRYTFQVRAVNSAGPDKTPAKRRFKIR